MPATAPETEFPPGFAEENKGPLILGVTSSLTALTLLFVLARVYSRILSANRLAVDDYIVILCICLSISYVGVAAVAISYGGGRHVAILDPADVTMAVKYTVISFVPGVSSFIIPKFAVVILLAKLLNPGRIHKTIMWVVSILYLLLAAGMLVINFAQCTPAAAQWGGAEGTCWDRKITVDYALALGAVSVVFDFYLAIYPTVVLSKLHMSWKKKLALSSSLGFGYCAGAVTIYKCTTLEGLLHLQDFTYAVDDVVLWTNIEANCVLIGACIPTLYPLLKKIWGSSVLGGSTPNNKGSSGHAAKSGPASNGIVTIGSYPTGNKKKRSKLGSQFGSQFETLNDDSDSKYIILEERSFQADETRDEETAAIAREQARRTKEPGW
ncbi:hypothetical protein B0H66DRAFT_107629 [Apodospora peruviana]|uniref:Rhodopsin domain-containing protein n=1 Tax=Apodospora peruviana TaxID=516989 RepID=A0AAE0IH27_9PEZI|nr:hypothetical protein B0H66DRAFT_107629 [Apodospora peruviana]